MSLRRWLFRITLCLVLGVVTTVGVAFVGGYYAQSSQTSYLNRELADADDLWWEIGYSDWPEEVILPFDESEILDWINLPEWETDGIAARHHSTLADYDWLFRRDRTISRANLPGSLFATSQWEIVRVRAGWPFRCFSCFARIDDTMTEVNVVGGVRYSGTRNIRAAITASGTARPREHFVPMTPIYGALFSNIAMHGTFWFVLFFTPAPVVRYNRKRRGVCPMCKYDLRGQRAHGQDARATANSQEPQANSSVYCPECGWGRSA